MPSEITDAMVEAAMPAYEGSSGSVATAEDHIRSIITAALATRPAPEAGSVVEALRGHPYDRNGNTDILECLMRMSEAADLIESQAAAIAEREERIRQLEFAESARNTLLKEERDAAEARAECLEKALRFYASERRYNGANQRNDGTDEFTSPNAAYIQDVTRDGGSIARAALQQEGESDV